MLAVAQARIVAGALTAARRGLDVELVRVVTGGDRYRGALSEADGKGMFTSELEAALLGGGADLAVHSAKDVPGEIADGLTIAAVPVRADPRDALVSRWQLLADLPPGASVGTSSLRRRALILADAGDVSVVAVRGNVETRVGRVLGDGSGASGQSPADLDAVILAMAGLERAALAGNMPPGLRATPLDPLRFVPAAGQGALAVQIRSDDAPMAEIVSAVNDEASHDALLAERWVVGELGADCHSCVGVYVWPESGAWRAVGMVARRSDGAAMLRCDVAAGSARRAGEELLSELLARGAERVLSS